LNLSVVVFDNNGGGIFSYLPIADRAKPAIFEAHFRTPHGAELGGIVSGFGAEYARIGSWEHFRASLKSALAAPGVSVVEIPVDRDRSVAHHREIDRRVSEALARGGAGEVGQSGDRDGSDEAGQRVNAGEVRAPGVGEVRAPGSGNP
jgi:2-succinyl-5-enolpyruvyl-6-hydroxy-3-cyclohexene-1-carboxylate synthase